MAGTLAEEGIVNTISGRVVLKESGVGIPNLLVALFSMPAAVPSAPTIAVPPSATRVGSVLTSKDGAFTLDHEDADLKVAGANIARPNLYLTVSAPEEQGVHPESLLLYSSSAARQNAGSTEQYFIRLTTEQLQKAQIPLPSEVSEDLEPSTNLAGRLKAMAVRQNDFITGAVDAAKDVVVAHRSRVSTFNKNFKGALHGALSNVADTAIAPERLVRPGESVFAKSSALTAITVRGTINDPANRAPVRGFISLTADQVAKLRSKVGPDGIVPAAAVASVTGNDKTPPTTYVQALARLPVCQPSTPSLDCTDSILNPSSASPESPSPAPGTEDKPIASEDVPRFLGRLMEPLTAPEEALVVGLMPIATRDSVQNSVQSFVFNPSPADVPAFYDFNNLQIAFEYVWQEVIRPGYFEPGAERLKPSWGWAAIPTTLTTRACIHYKPSLLRESSFERPCDANGHCARSPRGISGNPHCSAGTGWRIGTGFSSSEASCPSASAGGPIVRDHRTGVVNPLNIAESRGTAAGFAGGSKQESPRKIQFHNLRGEREGA